MIYLGAFVRALRASFGTRLLRGSTVIAVTLLGATCRSDGGTEPCVATVLAFLTPPSAPTAGVPFSVTVQARDNSGNVATCFTGNVSISFLTNPGGATLSGATTMAATAGVATFSNLSINKSAAGYTLSAAATGLSAAVSAAITVQPAAANRLAVTIQPPVSITAGQVISPPIVVTVQDAFLNTVTSFSNPVTLVITAGTGSAGAVLSGTTTLSANSGVATFFDLKIDKSGTGYTLSAIVTGLTGSTTNPFTVIAGAVDHLAFTVPPTGVAAGATIAPPVQVAAQDAGNNTVTTFTGNVIVAITAGTGTPGATLAGTTTATVANGRVVNGVATFNDLRINLAGGSYTLSATSGAFTATSAPFTISVGAVDHLAFSVQPTGVAAGTNIAPPVQVTAQDAGNNTVTTFTGNVIVAITAGTGTPGAALGGTTTATVANGRVVNGVATFNDLSINLAGSNYTLTATSGAFTATSSPFTISIGAADHLAFTVQPSNTTGGATLNAPGSVQVTAQDAANNTVTGYTGDVAVALVTNPGATGTLTGTTTATVANGRLVNGVATFNDLKIDKAGTGYRLLATSGSLTTALSNTFNITVGPVSQFAFTVQPTNTAGGAVINAPGSVQVTAQDAGGNTVVAFTSPVTVAIAPGTGTAGAALIGTTTATVANGRLASGVATFNDLKIDKAGNGYRLQASSGAVSSLSDPFNITVGPVDHLAFTVQPTSTTGAQIINSPGGVQVTAQDAGGNTVVGFTGAVAVAIEAGTGTGGAVLNGTTTATVANGRLAGGVATFNNLSINLAGIGYRLRASSGVVTSALSSPFNIVVGTVDHFAFTAPPGTTTAGAIINSPAGIQVTAQDVANNTVDFNGQVTMTLGVNPASGTLSGTTALNAINGVATFTTLSIDKSSGGYQLLATGGGASSLSATFTITAAPATKLAFTVAGQPTTTTAGATIAAPGGVLVVALDQFDNTDPTYVGNVTVAVSGGAAPLFGTTTATVANGKLVNGVATFNDLNIQAAATGYTLSATGPGVSGATSASFNINPAAANALAFTVQPSAAVSGAVINAPAGVQVTVLDQFGNTVTAFSGSVTVAVTGAAAPLFGTTTATIANGKLVNGVATFNDLNIQLVGNYTLSATGTGGLVGPASNAFNITHGSAAQLSFTQQPTLATAGANIAPSVIVTVQDAAGNTVQSFTGPVTIQITGGTGTANAQLSGGASVQVPAASAGVATFTGAQALSIDSAGTNYTLTANINAGAISKASTPFNINAGTATQLAFTVQPAASTVAGQSILGATGPSVIVRAQDVLGNTNPNYTTSVVLATTGAAAPLFGTNCAAGTCTASTANLKLVSGVATFDNFNIRLAGNGYTLRATSGTLTAATSAAFNITADVVTQIGFITQPTNTRANHTIDSLPAPGVQVAAQDQFGNTNPTWPNSVTLTISTDPGIGGSNLSGGTTASTGNGKLANGVATFNDLKINKGGAGFVLQATSGSLSPVASQAFAILALYVSNNIGNTIGVFPAEATGNATPTAAIAGANTTLSGPAGIALDAQGNLYVAGFNVNRVTVYAAGATGNTAPLRTLSGGNTGLNVPVGVAVDAAGFLYVANRDGNSITVYGPGANGNAAPSRTIVGGSTLLNGPFGLALDAGGNLYVANLFGNSILVFGPGVNGNVAPTRNISGASTNLSAPGSVTLDALANIYVANGTPSVTIYAAGANGNATPSATIAGALTGLARPAGIAFFGGNIYVANFDTNTITIYGVGADGNVPPSAVIQGAGTGLVSPFGLAF